jgi:hypothetical protein
VRKATRSWSRKAVRFRSSTLSDLGIKAEYSPQGSNAVLFSITAWDAEGWFTRCSYGSGDQLINTAVRVPVFLNKTLLL